MSSSNVAMSVSSSFAYHPSSLLTYAAAGLRLWAASALKRARLIGLSPMITVLGPAILEGATRYHSRDCTSQRPRRPAAHNASPGCSAAPPLGRRGDRPRTGSPRRECATLYDAC